MYLLDTNVISELRRGRPAQSPAARAWAAGQALASLYISAVTVLELEVGVLQMERRDARQGKVLRAWFSSVMLQFHGRTLPFHAATARLCAAMHVPDPASYRDSMIAATAAEHRFSLVTRNERDFRQAGITVVNPWLHSAAA